MKRKIIDFITEFVRELFIYVIIFILISFVLAYFLPQTNGVHKNTLITTIATASFFLIAWLIAFIRDGKRNLISKVISLWIILGFNFCIALII